MYTVTITDAHQCIYIDSVNFNKVPPPFSVNIDPHNVKCYGSKDGSIYITPVGGVPPYLYYWNFDTSSATRNLPLTNIDTGLYILTLFDSVRCVILDTIHISEPAPLNVSHSSTAAICNNSNTGTATETANGGTPPYTFSWNAGADTGQTITGKGAGQYIVIVTDSNGCKKTDTATITQPPPMATQVTHTNVSCYAGADGHAGVTANGGTTPYSYNWNNGQYNTQNIQALPAGHYVVVVTDSNHCTATDSTDITQPGPITGSRQVSICASDSFYTGGSYQTVAGIYIDTLHALNGCDSILSTDLSVVSQFTGQFQQTVCYGQGYNFNGTYYSSGGIYSDTLVSSGGCDSIVTFTLNVLPDIGLYASPDEATILAGDSITVNIYSNSNDIVSYSWSPNYGISCANCSTSIVMPGSNVRYTVIAVDTNGCRDTVSIPIIVEGGVIFVPNVFTPNGDGVNDVFKVYGRGFRKFKLMVFDRWGEKLFETTNPNEGWNGTYKGQPMPPAVYVYLIDVDFLSGITPPEYYQFKKGSITLLR
jgi:gliding motility-associated-like protein